MTLSQASGTDKIRALAELDGWIQDPSDDKRFIRDDGKPLPNERYLHNFKYLTSYDAILPVAQKYGIIVEIRTGTKPADIADKVLLAMLPERFSEKE